LKKIFTEHKKELEVRLRNSEGKTFSALLQIVKKLKDPYFLPCLKELFEKKNIPEVKDVLFSLFSRKDIIAYIDHPDTSVRIIALEKLKAIWTPEEFEIIRKRILNKKFWRLSMEEIKALLELLSTLKTDDTIKIFNIILHKRHFFRDKIYEIKKIAIDSLSKIDDEKAIELIARYKNSRVLKEKAREILKQYETE
jgi:HEAT repeat protein